MKHSQSSFDGDVHGRSVAGDVLTGLLGQISIERVNAAVEGPSVVGARQRLDIVALPELGAAHSPDPARYARAASRNVAFAGGPSTRAFAKAT